MVFEKIQEIVAEELGKEKEEIKKKKKKSN